MSSSEGFGAGTQLAELGENVQRLVEQVLREGQVGTVPAEAVQKLVAAAARLYRARHELEPGLAPFGEQSGVTATDVMVLASSMLKALDLELFELAMWQVWART